MTKRMMAARAYAGETRLRLEEIDVPSIRDDEVIVRIRSSGINRVATELEEIPLQESKTHLTRRGWEVGKHDA